MGKNASLSWQLDLGIPAMTKCCNLLDTCYETCGTIKQDCDSEFRTCLRGICSDVNKSLGFESKVQGRLKQSHGAVRSALFVCLTPLFPSVFITACSSMADTLHSMVQTLGCRPYMNGQRAACFCEGEEKDELWHPVTCTPTFSQANETVRGIFLLLKKMCIYRHRGDTTTRQHSYSGLLIGRTNQVSKYDLQNFNCSCTLYSISLWAIFRPLRLYYHK